VIGVVEVEAMVVEGAEEKEEEEEEEEWGREGVGGAGAVQSAALIRSPPSLHL